MISTQVALLSKQYAVIFNQFLPRKTVDYLVQFPQCEDLLFNFLVAHVGKNAPIKVRRNYLVFLVQVLLIYFLSIDLSMIAKYL